MNFTPGEMFFYGGIAGMCLVAAVSVIVVIALLGGGKRLRRMFDEEYGQKVKD